MNVIVCSCGARLELIVMQSVSLTLAEDGTSEEVSLTEDITDSEQITYLQDENGFSFWDK